MLRKPKQTGDGTFIVNSGSDPIKFTVEFFYIRIIYAEGNIWQDE